MPVKIIVDSCCEVPQLYKDRVHVAPLSVDIDNVTYIDDENLNIARYKEALKNMSSFKTACPSPQDYLALFEGEEDVIVITLSENLSGSYQSAKIAQDMYFDKYGNKKTIHILNSKSASAGETAILVKVIELCDAFSDMETIISKAEQFRDEHKVLFVLQSLTNLAKAGRVNPLVAKAAGVLGIRCIMGRDEDGRIELKQKIVGEKKCLRELAKQVAGAAKNMAEKTLCISHCEGVERVENFLKDLAEHIDLKNFKNIFISHTGGISSIYADFGGIIVAL
ncbi:MAG: DegV family protein [Eubacteriales bacterium]|jgi:DegV family protein with EDD domain|nr:DegV family protein [Eubacteriales bacterium]